MLDSKSKAILTLGGLGIWAFVDWVIILINALSQSKNGVFGVTKWNDKDDNLVFYVAIIFLILHVGILPGLIAGLIGLIMGGIGMSVGLNNSMPINTTTISVNSNKIFTG